MGIPFLQDQNQLMYSKASGCLWMWPNSLSAMRKHCRPLVKNNNGSPKKLLKRSGKSDGPEPSSRMSNLEIKLSYLNTE